ncbi:gluconate 2-dehydrogenase subunit 3 family protein [Haloferax larsenii]|uniref:Gluconate 2-dehydrogenase subunit 3 n=1 Tax=Haloferax larsenii TaxID=302484 RepID=A0A1H7IQB1_HALLR|nr:gluconate 2-dehydrogenase subunit 3 family protein [Haloferax larsenii]SEK63780.1 Gluconate 2-dehydrogenase subunit 3 [Haloferax larsenii]
MRLTRRDAIAVLAGLGVVGGGAVAVDQFDPPTAETAETGETGDDGGDGAVSATVTATMTAAAEVVYPSQTEGVADFVETYVVGRARDESRRDAMRDAALELDAIARDWYGDDFADLSADDRDSLLRELGVAAADPVADGNVSERIRFHVVNELLYAFYASPTGGRLVGIENPIGHAGGTESYQRATMPEGDAGRVERAERAGDAEDVEGSEADE